MSAIAAPLLFPETYISRCRTFVPPQYRHVIDIVVSGSRSGSKQHNAILTGVGSDSDDLPVIVDAQRLNHFPSSFGLQKVVQIVKLIVAVKEPVKVLVAPGQRPAYDFAVVVKIASNAERAAQSSQHAACPVFLPEGFDPAGVRVEGHACKLGAVVESEHIVAVVIERAEINDLEFLRMTGGSLVVLSCLHKLNCFHKT